MNTLPPPLPFPGPARRLLAALTLLACGTQAHAALRVGETSGEGVAAGLTPELALIVWDPVKEVSYIKDLGLEAYKEYYELGNTSTNLFVYGQQDGGFQKLFNPLNTDPNFLNFLTKSPDVSNQIWAVVGISFDPNGPAFAMGSSMYMTLKAETPTGTVNPQYANLLKAENSEWANVAGLLAQRYADVSAQAGSCSDSCFTDYATNSSYVNVKGQLAYAGSLFLPNSSLQGGSSISPSLFNAVNSSSWFYATTLTSDNSTEFIAIDEFDNLSHDAYWGLGVDATGNYILSYTLQAHLTQAQTAAGSLLRLRTDFAAQYGSTRLISVPGGSLDLGGAVTAVPEPATWGLMGLGLALLAGRARRQQRG